MKITKQVEWEEIEIGEIFATKGCWEIFCKISEYEALYLASSDHFELYEEDLGEIMFLYQLCPEFYKLSPESQLYWK